MTNNDIIFMKSQELAKNGIISYTGREFTMTYADGSQGVIRETEKIHTFAEWKKSGYKVKKGSHAVAKFAIWMYTDKPSRATVQARETAGQDTDAPDPHYYMKESAFFSASQVQPMDRDDRNRERMIDALEENTR